MGWIRVLRGRLWRLSIMGRDVRQAGRVLGRVQHIMIFSGADLKSVPVYETRMMDIYRIEQKQVNHEKHILYYR